MGERWAGVILGAIGGFGLGWFTAFFIVWRDQKRQLDDLLKSQVK